MVVAPQSSRIQVVFHPGLQNILRQFLQVGRHDSLVNEKSNKIIVPMKRPNKEDKSPAEVVEERVSIKGISCTRWDLHEGCQATDIPIATLP